MLEYFFPAGSGNLEGGGTLLGSGFSQEEAGHWEQAWTGAVPSVSRMDGSLKV